MRIAIAQIIQESNTFAPFATTRAHFAAQYIATGDTLLAKLEGTGVEVAGMLAVLRESQVTPVPLLATHGSCGGPLTRDCFEGLMADLLAPLRAGPPVDGVLLVLHGAMAVEDEPDSESEIIERVRACLPAGTPVGVSLDLHAHVTPRMLQPHVFFVGYQAFPHVDMFTTGQATARLLLDTLAGRRRPVMALAKRPMIISPVNSRTTDGPMTAVVASARAMEASGRVLHASYFMVQPWLDFEDLGFAALVCADGDAAAAEAAAEDLAEQTWGLRDALLPDLTPLEDAIRAGLAGPGLTVIGDTGDAPSSGAPGDNATVLRTLLALGADKAERPSYLTLVDAPAAAQATAAGPGAEIEVALGHGISTGDGAPVTVRAIVRALTDGVYTMADPGLAGVEAHMGPTAVLAIGRIRVAVRSVAGFEWDTGLYTSAGLELRKAAMVFVKSPSHFRATFGPHGARVLSADTPGASACNIRRVPFKQVRRPIHPLDPL